MSTRLHKVIGYALTDLTPEDRRINHDSPLLSWSQFEEEGDGSEAPTLDGYAAWLNETAVAAGDAGARIEAALLRNALPEKLHTDLADCVLQNEDAPEVLVLIPPAYLNSWHRCDDDIDYIEASMIPDADRRNSLVRLTTGIGAFSGRFMDLDGTELDANAEMFVKLARTPLPEEELDSFAAQITPRNRADGRRMFATAAEAADRIVPCVPSDVRRLASYGQLFTSDAVWKLLRPIHYAYWE